MICAKNNPKVGPPIKEVWSRGTGPGEDWKIDFIMMPRATGNFRYVLVFLDRSTGWGENFPCLSQKASEVVKAPWKEIVPSFELPMSIQSDNKRSFDSKIIQKYQVPWIFIGNYRHLGDTAYWKDRKKWIIPLKIHWLKFVRKWI